MTIIQNKCEKKISFDKIGISLFLLYIFTSYIANGALLPTKLNSYTLYLFLGYSIIKILISNKLIISSMSVWQFLFLGVSLISTLYSPENNILSGAFYSLIVNFIIVLFLFQYNLDKKSIRSIILTYAISGVSLVILLFITNKLEDMSGRLGTELLGNANAFSNIIMISCLCTIWYLLYGTTNPFLRLFLILFILVDYYAMFLSGGRKYILVPLVFFYFLLIFMRDKKGKTHFLRYTLIIVIIALIGLYLVMNVSTLYEVIGKRIEEFFAFLQGDLSRADGSSVQRGTMIQIGIKRWLRSPLWGYGFDSFKFYNQIATGSFYYSHNNFVELLYNQGLIGFIVYYFFYIKIFNNGICSNRDGLTAECSFAVALIVSLLIYEITQVDYTNTSVIVMLFIAYNMLKQNKGTVNKNEK